MSTTSWASVGVHSWPFWWLIRSRLPEPSLCADVSARMPFLLYRHSKGLPIMSAAPGEHGAGASQAIGQSVTARGVFVRLTLLANGNLILYARRPAGEVVRWATATD